MKAPSKADLAKFTTVVFLGGVALGAGLTSYIATSRGKRRLDTDGEDD